VTDYGLDDQGLILGREKDCIQTSSGAHPASYPVDSRGLSPAVTYHSMKLATHFFLVPRLRMHIPVCFHGVMLG